MTEQFPELSKNLKYRKRMQWGTDGNKFFLILDQDDLKMGDALEMLKEVRKKVPKTFLRKRIRVYTVGVFHWP